MHRLTLRIQVLERCSQNWSQATCFGITKNYCFLNSHGDISVPSSIPCFRRVFVLRCYDLTVVFQFLYNFSSKWFPLSNFPILVNGSGVSLGYQGPQPQPFFPFPLLGHLSSQCSSCHIFPTAPVPQPLLQFYKIPLVAWVCYFPNLRSFSLSIFLAHRRQTALSKTTSARHSAVYGRFAAHRYPQNKCKTPGSVAAGSVHGSGRCPSLARYALFSYSVKCLPILRGNFTYSFEKACSIARCRGHNHENEKYHPWAHNA